MGIFTPLFTPLMLTLVKVGYAIWSVLTILPMLTDLVGRLNMLIDILKLIVIAGVGYYVFVLMTQDSTHIGAILLLVGFLLTLWLDNM